MTDDETNCLQQDQRVIDNAAEDYVEEVCRNVPRSVMRLVRLAWEEGYEAGQKALKPVSRAGDDENALQTKT